MSDYIEPNFWDDRTTPDAYSRQDSERELAARRTGWGVFEYRTGAAWHVSPPTEAQARYEVSQLEGGHEAWPLNVCMAMTNAFAHGRMRGLQEAAGRTPSVTGGDS